MPLTHPILYSFRRCPYAIRARMILHYSNIQYEHREIKLSNKPEELLLISPKATVPVMQLQNGNVLDESLDIMKWSLKLSDPENYYPSNNRSIIDELIQINDIHFKALLDNYKYPQRDPQFSQMAYRQRCLSFIENLNKRLECQSFLIDNNIKLADIAIFPFIRQFSKVDETWFKQSPYTALINWLNYFTNTNNFQTIMKKYAPWKKENSSIIIK